MQVEDAYVSTLEESVQSLVESQSPSDIFKILLTGSQSAAPRGTIFLIRQGMIKGWGSIGYDENVARAQRAFRTASDQGWLGELVSDPDGAIRIRSGGGNPDFGQAAPSDSAAMTVRVRGRSIAVLMIERSAGEGLWLPNALSLLVTVAQLRLELDLALRKLKSGPPVAGPDTGATKPDSGPVHEPVEESVAPAVGAGPAAEQTNAPSAETVQLESIDLPAEEPVTEVDVVAEVAEEDAELAAARRFARLVATDIRLYNEDAVIAGRQEKDLADRLADQLSRGKTTFLQRHGSMGSAAIEILHQAYVEVLAAGEEEILPVSVLD
ncbi:MAG: hypothetical protein GTN89_07765 [Acidobacteria bacterium]|nr:hypothetical protein [Acidobacteriota bacterium]NIM64229.1 hypothetical protein [Acidobacteriota bacterium]NIO59227.1 hypothetical protein [Acidobacteriota bacterium]NIQ30254.1 hypothetical protein [Acidobacteriota bacterium]NIQ85182.1 hypothetical protein [Acidobacteriota bacterium]